MTISGWLHDHESLAIWIEGIALILIFGLELKEYWRQGRERKEQHEELAAQMKIARDAADAARLNAQAVINAERAWIVVTAEASEPDVFEFRAKNVGKTPAKFVSSFCEMSVLDRSDKLPAEPTYKTEMYDGLQPTLFPPTDARAIFRKDLRKSQLSLLDEELLRCISAGFKEVYFFGSLSYVDTLAPEKDGKPVFHETKWCFKLIPIVGALPLSHPYLFPPSYVDYS